MDALKRLELLEKIAALAGEYCVAVDLEADDIGGAARSSLTVLQEIGPLTHKLEAMDGLTTVAIDVQRDTISCEVYSPKTLNLYVRGAARGDCSPTRISDYQRLRRATSFTGTGGHSKLNPSPMIFLSSG